MNKKLVGIVGIALSILLLVYFEGFVYKIFNFIGFNITNYSNTVQILINLGIKLLMCVCVYLLFKKDFRSRRGRTGTFKTLLVFIVSLVALVMGMYLFEYVVRFIGDIFNVDVLNRDFYNIFNKKLNIELIVKIITDYLFIPFLYCSLLILSIDKIFRREGVFIAICAILASIIHALSLSGTLGFIIINSMSTFILFGTFAFLYKKHYSIWFIILLYSKYLIGNGFIINYLGW